MIELNPLYENIITNLSEKKYAIIDTFFDEELLGGLLETANKNILQSKLHEAGIGNQSSLSVNKQIRSDKILWLDEKGGNRFEKRFFEKINHFSDYLNQTCYTGINGSEFHYACYEPGTFYKKHIDRFKNDNARKFSVITYLNLNWKDDSGGELVVYTLHEKVVVKPEFGKTVIFKSDELEHEVLVSNNRRLSITGWLK